ncbi:MAG: RNA pyrophosphohydrolase [Rickettsiales bacterium]
MTLPYRDGVGMMLINAQGLVFVAKRIDMITEAWQMPQGGVDAGEELRAAAMRELEEEVGTRKADIIAESADYYYYDLPDDIIPKVWGGQYRGQRQKWYALRFSGTDADINIETEEPEFSEWKWVQPAELPNVIVPFKRDLYQALVQEFRNCF